ncbi:Mce protein [Mycobacterium sp.]|uniref:Mce protein n=1 Tax=Mycobacterium sp. TaxID=1785 RepID=UPI0025D0E8BB|nr:Mce protein [Mycobacterium sp.]
MQLMNHRPSLPTVGNPRTWLVSRFRIAAEGTETDGGATEAVQPDEVDDHHEDSLDGANDRRPSGRKGRRLNVARWAAAGTLAVVLAGAGYEGWLLFQHHQKDVASAQALDAAKKYILALTSVDTNAIDQNFAEVLDGSTGEFKDMYTKSSAQLRQTLIDNKAAAHGSVVDAAVQSATEDKVDVVLFVDQSVSNGAAPAPQLDRSRVKMTMERVDGRWLASKVELP